jgi:hypothetical protein
MTKTSKIPAQKNMMDQFQTNYIPGGMSLNHNGWWVCLRVTDRDGSTFDYPIKMIRKD